jgi:hypothetical protein
MESKSHLDIFVLDLGGHSIRAGRAEDFPAEKETPHIVLPSAVTTASENDVEAEPHGDTGKHPESNNTAEQTPKTEQSGEKTPVGRFTFHLRSIRKQCAIFKAHGTVSLK